MAELLFSNPPLKDGHAGLFTSIGHGVAPHLTLTVATAGFLLLLVKRDGQHLSKD